jgi:hypothetical protein
MRIFFLFLSLITNLVHADTIEHYMSISSRIPQMEVKADAQAQAWARSARIVLEITCEGIAETMMQANETAKNQGAPLFCLPNGTLLNAYLINNLIEQTYNSIASQQSDKNTMTVSQVAWLAVTKNYPCQKPQVTNTQDFMQISQK